ncbi:sensor histidine kinase [Algoriphagus sp. A40]|uniref:sensor histidine kinase n=1 Tax=Algoriphagus sp. A40 TaxID=1945863 RepID=UPI0009852641|nr:ATP-binding protein [Algoriphagus sp. A40]OOG70470.1 hypothetical protein B0E43_17845 [Algoriphagus sp. A40]
MSVNGETGDFENSELKRDQQDSNEKIISEEQKLRIELKKVSAELNARKRELEIESALEKVRATAMGMHKSEDLRTVVQILYDQLRNLGFQLGVASITIMDPDTGDIDWWMEGFDSGYFLPERYHVPFFNHPGHLQQLAHWKSGTPYAEIEISGQEKKTYDAYYFFKTDFAKAPESSKQLMMQQESVRFSMAYMKYGALSWSPTPLSKEQAKVMERFAKVFEQCYTRFLDLQKAESQTREAQIEAALERVRSRTMAMHKSDELSEVAVILFNEVKSMGLDLWGCGFNIWEMGEKECTSWMSTPDGRLTPPFRIPLTEIPLFIRFDESLKNGVDFYVEEIRGIELEKNYRYMSQLPVLGEGLKAFLNSGRQVPTFQIDHVVNFSHGNLIFITYHPCPEAHDIFKRFGKVFEQTYTRFLDLQKAEAQAREAQIEAALEKIRSRSLAMHQSGELREVIAIFFEKLIELDALLGTVGIALYDPKSKDISYWVGNSIQDPQLVAAPFDEAMMKEDNFISQSWKAVKEKTEMINEVYSKEQKDRYFEHLFAHNNLVQIPESAREILRKMESHVICFFPNKHSSLFADSWDGRKYSEDSIGILRRAARVFEQTYVRFLDLQKAESQAREAQIEAALERVRARTMGLQKSEELRQVVKVLYNQLKELGFDGGLAGIIIMDPDSGDVDCWAEGFDDGYDLPEKYHVPYFDHPGQRELIKHWKSGAAYAVVEIAGQEKQSYNNYFFSHTDFAKIPEATKQFMMQQEGLMISMAYMQYGALNWSPSPISDEQAKILQRFAKVFEQTYTRFLDLQKAEAQAREAQIEAALERVRSRSLAMHHSDELEQVVLAVSERLSELGLLFDGTLIFISDSEERKITLWISTYQMPTPLKVHLPFDSEMKENAIWKALWNSRKKGESVLNKTYSGKTKDDYFRYVQKYNSETIPPDVRQLELELPNWTISYSAEKNSMLGVDSWTGKSVTEEEFQILIRFGRVFEQAFIRFLDLQKAESQAREAHIEAALERVRARTMGMQKSEDLRQVVKVLYSQLKELGFKQGGAAINIMDPDSGDIDSWGEGYDDGYDLPEKYHVPYSELPGLRELIMYWKSGTPFAVVEIAGQEKKSLDNYYFFHTDFTKVPETTKQFMMQQEALVFSMAYMRYGALTWTPGSLSEEQAKILQRFSKVFEQSYTRFIDLQKAESQARESQIEAALERVRARTMAMHSSSELIETAELLFDQLKQLGAESQGVAFAICEKENIMVQKWTSIGVFSVPYTYEPGELRMYEAWKNQTEIYEEIYEGERLKKYYELFMEIPEFKQGIQKFIDSGYPLPDWQKNHAIPFKYGYLLLITLKPFEETHIFSRFAKVFEQTYTRFLDLQKAEAQAREAQIEVALERVRAKAMAMHVSQELNEVVYELRNQLGLLGQKELDTCVIHLHDESPDFIYAWAAMRPPESSGEILESSAHVPKKGLLIIEEALRAYSLNMQDYVLVNEGEKIMQWFGFLQKEVPEAHIKMVESAKGIRMEDVKSFWSFADFAGGSLLMVTVDQPEETSRSLLRRFANVFGLAYRRFADLKQAEAQARESQIQLALERVRARTMAMQHSDELAEAAFVLFQQLQALGIVHERINIGIVKEETNTIDFWITEQGGNQINTRFSGKIDEPTTLSKMYTGWKKNQKSMVIDQTGDDLENWLRYLKDEIGIPFDPAFLHHRRVQTVGFFSKGMLVVTTPEPLPEENLGLLVKFAGVFDLTYTRFSDLKHAEAQAREAQIEVALERIRTRALAMQTSTELSDVANVLREQMGILGQEDLEASVVHLYSADSPTFASWYAFRAGDKIIEGQTTFRLENSALAKEFLKLYLDEITEYTIEVKGAQLKEWLAEIKINAPQIADYWGDLPPEKQFYHFSDFSGGALLMVSHQNLSEETQMLQKRCALVFELAYKRFLDLEAKERQDMELREEKQRLEKALSELKATQSQLIQSEKMASLGQLTAGIAHEIKNPLNFVNNFSEVSSELIDEVFDELEKLEDSDCKEEIIAILTDVKNNIGKVSEHGKRADGIVKSMLQHSRSSGNKIESKAFNPIVKEFANLAFHGMRAGKAPINVEIDLQLDPEVGEVKLISDDFSRVILNLCNNAFDAMRDKLQEASESQTDFLPKLTLSTKKTSDQEIQLVIGDNGKGIPKEILDKILEPFFTTKKGTEGTGLGLSISYDIIKAHGGKLEVNSTMGVGTEFIIQIPIDF